MTTLHDVSASRRRPIVECKNDRRQRKPDDMIDDQRDKLVELVASDLIKILRRRGIEVDHTARSLRTMNDGPSWEIDIITANGDEVVAVEVGTVLNVSQVTYFIEMLKVFPDEAPSTYRGKRVYGAMAYLKTDESADVYAERQGLFVIKATGSGVSFTNAEDFTPRTFGG